MLHSVAPMASSVPMTKCIIFCIILLFSLFFTKIYSEHSERLERLISRLENGVTFYEKNYKHINIDGIFGLRVIEGKIDWKYTGVSHVYATLTYKLFNL